MKAEGLGSANAIQKFAPMCGEPSLLVLVLRAMPGYTTNRSSERAASSLLSIRVPNQREHVRNDEQQAFISLDRAAFEQLLVSDQRKYFQNQL